MKTIENNWKNKTNMPKDFDNCVAAGGRVRTKKIDAEHYIHICIPKGGGKGDSVSGEVKEYKKILGKKK